MPRRNLLRFSATRRKPRSGTISILIGNKSTSSLISSSDHQADSRDAADAGPAKVEIQRRLEVSVVSQVPVVEAAEVAVEEGEEAAVASLSAGAVEVLAQPRRGGIYHIRCRIQPWMPLPTRLQ